MIGDAIAKMSDNFADRVTDRVASVGLKVSLLVAAGLSVSGAIAAAAVALFWWLQPQFGTVSSLLITAAGFLVLAVIAYLSASIVGRPKPTEHIEPMQVLEDEGREAVDTMGGLQFVLAAAGVGALIGLRLSGRPGATSAGASIASLISPAISLYTALASKQATTQTGVEPDKAELRAPNSNAV